MEACPTEGEKNCVLDPITMSAVTDALKATVQSSGPYLGVRREGPSGKEWAGLDWWEDQNILSFTTGTPVGNGLLLSRPHRRVCE